MNHHGMQVGIWILVFGLLIGSVAQLLAGEAGRGGIFAGLALGLALLVCRQNSARAIRR